MTTSTGQTEFRALVVDDEAITRGMVVFALVNQGFKCDVATDGERAQTLLENGQYDLLVTDLKMPYMDGYALAMEVLGGDAPPSVIVHTAHEDPGTVKDLIERGVDDVISKPTDYAIFAAKARGLVARRKIDLQETTCADSTPAIDQATISVPPEVEAAESPIELAEQDLELSDIPKECSDSHVAPNVADLGGSNPIEAAAQVVAARKTAPVRVARVLKVSDWSVQNSSVKQFSEKKQTPAGGDSASGQKSGASIPLLIGALASIVLLTTALVTLSQIRDPRPTASEISQPAAARQYVTDDLRIPASREQAGPSPSQFKELRMASEPIERIRKLRSRLVKMASDLLLDEQRLVESDTKSPTLIAATHNLQREVATTLAAKVAGNIAALKSHHERQLAAGRARLEADYVSDLPEIRRWLAPILAEGFSQPQHIGQLITAVKGPMSLTALRRSGALTNSEEGLSKLARAMTYGNDRQTSGFAPFTGGPLLEEHRRYVLPASRLLLKYQFLLVEKGALAE